MLITPILRFTLFPGTDVQYSTKSHPANQSQENAPLLFLMTKTIDKKALYGTIIN
jgi:hypothetical protein